MGFLPQGSEWFILLAIVLIIFGEVAPKTFGALYPERIALPAARSGRRVQH